MNYQSIFKSRINAISKNIGPLFNVWGQLMINKKRVFLFGTPLHSNLGDQAQTACIINWFKNNYPDYHVISFSLKTTGNSMIRLIRLLAGKKDMFAFHSGYHLTDLYSEQEVYCRIASTFKDFPIVIFPQTINYTKEETALKTARIFNNHGRVTLLCRDQISFETAQRIFGGCKLLLYPDIVTSLIGTKSFNNKRDGILLCMRNDKEAFYNKNQISNLNTRLESLANVELTDTTIQTNHREIIKNRELILNGVFDHYSKYKLIITDRYHGTIFSLISGTPVIVLSSSDHKLSSGVKWFPDSFKDYVSYVENLDEAYKLADRILNTEYKFGLSPYFKERYWDTLKDKINNLN